MAEVQIDELLATIDTDAWVVPNHAWGGLNQEEAQSISCVCARIEAEEALSKAVKQSKGLAFVIERDTQGVRVSKKFPAADCLHHLINCQWDFWPKKHAQSIRSQEIAAILNRFNVQGTRFTKNPLALITEGVVEADIVNSITMRIYDAITGKLLLNKIKVQRNDLHNAYTKTERLLHRLLEHHSCLTGLPISLRYHGDYPKKDTLSHAEQHLQRFLALFENLEKSTGLVGYWWKHEYLEEHGYQHFALFWFRSTGTCRDALVNAIQVAWSDATDGHGYAVCNEFDARIPRSWGMQPLIKKGSVQLQDTLRSIQLMLLRDLYCRLSLWGATQPFGFSPLPRPILHMGRPNGNDLMLRYSLMLQDYPRPQANPAVW